MPSYDTAHCDPPAPVARVTLRDPHSGATVSDVLLLVATGADITLLPRTAVEPLGVPLLVGQQYELMGFDGSKSLRSSRRLEQETHRHVEWMWLFKKLRPDHKTSADFRKNNLKPIRQVCREFTVLCQQLELFAEELVAIDGSKFEAVNAKERNFTQAKLAKLLQPIDQRVEGYLQALDGQDHQDDAGPPGGAVADNLQAKIEALQPRKLLYPDLQAQLKASGETPLSLTDQRAVR